MEQSAVTAVFQRAAEAGASDVHIAVGVPVLFRIDGELVEQNKQPLTAAQVEQFVKYLLGDRLTRFTEEREMDVSFDLADGVRLRVNCLYERGNMSLAARIIPSKIPTPDELGLKAITEMIVKQDEGLVLFTGPTGMGKSTSLASIIAEVRSGQSSNIVTLEDPIEFLFPQQKGVMRQRQYGEDFRSFPEALRHVLRQDPDTVLVGEMRDPETIGAALTLAETGHLTLATLHTPNAIQTIDRIIDVFPPHQQPQVRSQLSLSLNIVVAQRLVPKVGGGRIAVREVLINTPAVANIIREGRAQELTSVMQTGESVGMTTFEKSAKALLKQGLITQETCELVAKL